MRNFFTVFLTVTLFATAKICNAQYVGIGTNTPNHPLTVISSGDGIVSKSATVEVGTYVNSTSAYLQTYSNHPLYFSTNNGSAQVSLLTNGNFGVGTANPTYKLDVNGMARITGDMTAGNDIKVDGDVTVSGGKGIMRSVNATQLKYYSRDAGFAITLGAFGSYDSNIGFTTGLFSSPPRVIVGDVVSGTGPFEKLKICIFNVGTNNCSVRLYNESNATISVDAVWVDHMYRKLVSCDL